MMISSNVAQPRHWSSVQGGRDVRAAPAERGAEQDHRRDPGIRPDQACRPDHRVPDQAADENREERIAERQGGDEKRADDEDEQRDAEVPPERQLVEEPEDAEALRDRVDAPGGRPVVHLGGTRAGAGERSGQPQAPIDDEPAAECEGEVNLEPDEPDGEGQCPRPGLAEVAEEADVEKPRRRE